MKFELTFLLLTLISIVARGQAREEKWGVVLTDARMKNVKAQTDVVYRLTGDDTLRFDIYYPPGGSRERLPAVLFLPEMLKDRSWELYKTWPKLIAANGLIGIVIDVNRSDYLRSVTDALGFLSRTKNLRIDTTRVAIFAASHIPDDIINAFVKEKRFPQIKAAALYYREPSLKGPFRTDLPVLYVTDDQSYFADDRFTPVWNEVQKSKAPWTLLFGAGMPHFFDAFEDTDDAKRIVRQTIYFLKNHLEPLPLAAGSEERAMIGALYSGNRTEARLRFKSFLLKHPDDQYALLRYGMLSFLESDYPEAETAYKGVIDLEPVYMIDLVKILLAQNKTQEAEELLKKALATGKVRRSPYAGIGAFLSSLGKDNEAVTFYEKALNEDEKGELYFMLAGIYARINRNDDALTALEKAFRLKALNKNQLETEKSFDRIRDHQRFQDLLTKLQ